jgi:hypothetical protein
MVNKGEIKKIERVLNKSEIADLVNGKHVLIAYFKHRYHSYELIGTLKELYD